MHYHPFVCTFDLQPWKTNAISGYNRKSAGWKYHTMGEKFNMWRSKSRSGVSTLWNKILTTNLKEEITELKIPIYFFHGVYDYTVSYTLAKNYYEKIHAPVKEFYTFEQSAHSPLFDGVAKNAQYYTD
jgi:esterase/lipase